MKTTWQGLWKQDRDAFYASKVIKKADIPEHTRIVLRYNKFYDKATNRPRFVYCFADSEGYEDLCIPIDKDNTELEELRELKEKVERLADIMRSGRNAPLLLPSESYARAEQLEHEAVELIEEMTGEEWEFAYYHF